MRCRTLALASLTVSVSLVLPAFAFAQLTTSHLISDSELNDILTNKTVVAEGRIGDRGGAATFELDLGQDTAAPAVTDQHDWQSGLVEPFTLSYVALANQVTFSLGGKILTYSPAPGLEEIFIRTRAVNDQSSVVVQNLVLDGILVGDQSSAAGPDGLDILRIQGGVLEDDFVLAGDAVLTWSGPAPTQSLLAFQIKIGTADQPTPSYEETWGSVKGRYR